MLLLSSSSLHISTQFCCTSSNPRNEPLFSASQLVDKAAYASPRADTENIKNAVSNGSHIGISHKCRSLTTSKNFNAAKPPANGTPTETAILTIILSNTTCGISSSSLLVPSLSALSLMVGAGGVVLIRPKPLAFAFGLC